MILSTNHLYHFLSTDYEGKPVKSTIMIGINEKEEESIDNIGGNSIVFTRGNQKFIVTKKDIYCYGEIDFDDDETLDLIDRFKFLNYLEERGVPIYSNYDYNTHSVSNETRFPLWTETWSPLTLMKLAHGYIGKPKRILLFNKTFK